MNPKCFCLKLYASMAGARHFSEPELSVLFPSTTIYNSGVTYLFTSHSRFLSLKRDRSLASFHESLFPLLNPVFPLDYIMNNLVKKSTFRLVHEFLSWPGGRAFLLYPLLWHIDWASALNWRVFRLLFFSGILVNCFERIWGWLGNRDTVGEKGVGFGPVFVALSE